MLNYEVYGKGNPVVLLHGYLENLKMWKGISEELAKNYQVILIDLPGHGKSKSYAKTHTMELMAQKVNEVLMELKIEKAVIAGHSMGGYVTLALAELFPENVRSFILLNSTSMPDNEDKKEQRLKAVAAAHKNLDTLIKMSVPNLFAEHKLNELKPEIEFTKKMAGETSVEGVEAALRGMRDRKDRNFLLENFEGNIGIIIGEFDKAVNPEELKKVIPKRENIQILNLKTGHMSYLEDFESTLKFLEKFLKNSAD